MPLNRDRLETLGSGLPERLGRGLEAEHRARLLYRSCRACSPVHDRLGGDVAGPHVLGEGPGDDLTNLLWG